jgi:acyl carrier protein
MTRAELLAILENVFELAHGELSEDRLLSEIDAWDSMSALSVIALFDSKLDKTLAASQLRDARKVSDIIELAGLQ